MYICGKCILTICMNTLFHVSMQKTVRPQSGLVKKKLPGARFPNMKNILYIHVLVKCDNHQKMHVYEKSSGFSSHVEISHVQKFSEF